MTWFIPFEDFGLPTLWNWHN